MITAIDFGCYAIRSAWRTGSGADGMTMRCERSEYVMLPSIERNRLLLDAHGIPRAECEDQLVVYGNQAARARWLSRIPSAGLFNGGMVPPDDPPARQILDLLTAAMLPEPAGSDNLCAMTVPGSERRQESREFLARLVRMRGFEPFPVSAAEAAMLAEGSDSTFTGITIVMGAETTEICLSRLGVPLVSRVLPVGADWVDLELARKFQIQTWDDTGVAWLDLEAVREWKHQLTRELRTASGERDQALARLNGCVLDQVAQAVRGQLADAAVRQSLPDQRFNVICCGGPTQAAGFTSALTERFMDHDVADRIQSVRTVDNPTNSVLRGLLISGELEARRRSSAAA